MRLVSFKRIRFKLVRNFLSENEIDNILKIVKSENPDSILSKLSKSLFKKYIMLLVVSKNIKLYLCYIQNKIIGYAIFAIQPRYLFEDFKIIRYKILFYLLITFKILSILNLISSFLKIDLLLGNFYKKIVSKSCNLHLLAIENNYQMQGIGFKFLRFCIKNIKLKLVNNKYLFCETISSKAENFYIKKLGFQKVGKKKRIFQKNFSILVKRI